MSVLMSLFVTFLGSEGPPEPTLEFCRDRLVPAAAQMVRDSNHEAMERVPELTRVVCEALGEDGAKLIKEKINPALETALDSQCKLAASGGKVFCDTVAALPGEFREKCLPSLILKYSVDDDVQFRLLAVSLISLVEDGAKVVKQLRSLSLDRVAQVRVAVVQALKSVKMDAEIVQYILVKATKDQAPSVQRAAAREFGNVAPKLVDDFKPLLVARETARAALKSVKPMVAVIGFAPLVESFKVAMKLQPDGACAVLLNISRVVDKNEHPLLVECAWELRTNKVLIEYLRKFSIVFDDKEVFLKMLDPEGIKKWRVRRCLLEQAVLFIDVFHERLTAVAAAFSNDAVAIVRDQSITLWAELIKDRPETAQSALEMLNGSFQVRLILAKLIGLTGIQAPFDKAAEILSKDPVSNVRYALASNLKSHEDLVRLFADCQDADIADLKEAH